MPRSKDRPGAQRKRTREDTKESAISFFLGESAQAEEGGNGGAVQQRGQGRMDICS